VPSVADVGVVAHPPKAAPAAPRTRHGWSRQRRKEALVGYLLIAPVLVGTAVFFFGPMAYSFYWSLTTYNGLAKPEWVGLQNYIDLFHDPLFRHACRNTAVFAVVTMSIGPALGLGSALLLNRAIRGRAFFRAVYFVPVTTSLVVVATIWRMLLNDQGLLNQALSLVGIPGHDWLADPSTALMAVCAASIWQGFGFETVIFLAALQTVPRELLEAAEVDGANALRRFWHVTLPAIRPTVVFVFVVGIIGAFQVFDQVFVMTQGGPLESTTTVVYYLVAQFRALDLGHASAAAYVLVVVLAVASAVQLRIGRDRS
jgi:ABC-type sugar transport system permease subunit